MFNHNGLHESKVTNLVVILLARPNQHHFVDAQVSLFTLKYAFQNFLKKKRCFQTVVRVER